MRHILRSLGLFFLVAILIACQPRVVQNTPQSAISADCRNVEHEGGRTQICGKPQKVAILEPKLLSMALALGVQPIAYADYYLVRSPRFDNPSQQIPYAGQFVTSQPINLGNRDTPSLELLKLLKPDLILDVSWRKNPLLSTIAPTISIDIEKTWQSNLKIVAQALDREKNVEAVLTSHQQALDRVRTQLSSLVETHPKVLSVITSPTMDHISLDYEGNAIQLLQEIGFQPVAPSTIDPSLAERSQIDLETLAQIDADIIFVNSWLPWDGRSTYNVSFQNLQRRWANQPLLHASQAWKEKRIYFVDYYLWIGTTMPPIANFLILEQLPSLLLTPNPSL
ncbi:iron-siderophore ABC transporter substrate-binding protein [Leptolyngbya boryana CZ1]|uniref:Iron-siderophore ABC transporter substrate-binding protein n=1 Tax=Leptolyngbya boryana CZ1 TaxID=3060204 RepID=A0AA96WW91_LEPBY|nr:iron-siderophore ABC transporter substrate-binding protein [Leptolyngbya boryana]WNZ46453.1 iron-siderophore ABC transporter substrate-binding protein [Leptolyngbya boryana CZ1]